MKIMAPPDKVEVHERCCLPVPQFQRLSYFYGQLLGHQEFQDEQDYFREKMKLLNRCLHGYGVVCGLEVYPEPVEKPCEPEVATEAKRLKDELEAIQERQAKMEKAVIEGTRDERKREWLQNQLDELEAQAEEVRRRLEELCPPASGAAVPTRAVIDCGVALDCQGETIVLRRPYTVDLVSSLTANEREDIAVAGSFTLWVSICFCELPTGPVRPVHSDTCSSTPGCRYSRILDSFRVQVSLEEPPRDQRCEPCCETCEETCLLLARIDCFRPGEPLDPRHIHNEVRRMLTRYEAVTITGINWMHGDAYTDDAAAELLGRGKHSNGGLEFHFSRPVLTDTLRRGIVDVWVIEGGGGRAGDIYHVPGEIADLPDKPTTSVLRYRQISDDKFHQGDRILIRLRTDFILDECCMPVDGNHVGGRVPALLETSREGSEDPDRTCADPPGRPGPWTSGNGSPGGLFESWIFIDSDQGA